jgi:hypothetical protein
MRKSFSFIMAVLFAVALFAAPAATSAKTSVGAGHGTETQYKKKITKKHHKRSKHTKHHKKTTHKL